MLGSGVGRRSSVVGRQEIILFILPTSPHPAPYTPHPTPYPHEKLFQQTLSRQNISLV
ncbi:hypothetical protein BFG60_3703 [Microcystis aeruginosa NIES-98]|nr:hypothetical protein BFG60_3703 [Microcystis aeruginosa NIES-98]